MPLNPVFHILGILLSVLAAAMVIPARWTMSMAILTGQVSCCRGDYAVFRFWSALVDTRQIRTKIRLRQAFLLTNGAWIMIGIFGALPFMLATPGMGLTNAIFESVQASPPRVNSDPVIELCPPACLSGGPCCNGLAASASSSWRWLSCRC